jgi:hypothetical protein
MNTHNGTNGNRRIALLKQKEREIRAKLAAEQVKQQKAKAKELKRDFADIGETLCKYAWQTPAFELTLKQMLAAASAVTDEPTRKRLSGRGWLS